MKTLPSMVARDEDEIEICPLPREERDRKMKTFSSPTEARRRREIDISSLARVARSIGVSCPNGFALDNLLTYPIRYPTVNPPDGGVV
ncbi:MAG: hypothetical protein AB1555_02640 [Nitrospirota bacterium]